MGPQGTLADETNGDPFYLFNELMKNNLVV